MTILDSFVKKSRPDSRSLMEIVEAIVHQHVTRFVSSPPDAECAPSMPKKLDLLLTRHGPLGKL
jgi:hypothetical protein